MGLKNNSKLFMAIKSKGRIKEFSRNQKIYDRLRKLGLINSESYFNAHPDCLSEGIAPELHYLYYGVDDDLETKKTYVNPLFDIDFYINSNLGVEGDFLIHFVTKGFFKGFLINPLDCGYVDTLEIPLSKQYNDNLNKKLNVDLDNFNYIIDKRITVPYLTSDMEFETSKIRVGVFINDPFENLAACPNIRIHQPLYNLSKSDKYIFFMYGMDSYAMMDINEILKEKKFDVIIVQRILPFLDVLLEKAKKHNIKLIYETDDDLLGVEPNSPSFEYVDRVRDEITNYIDNCDIVTVTTPALASKFPKSNVEIIRNYLVGDLDIKNSINSGDKIKLGYYGTLTHSKDLFLIKDAIIQLKKRMLEKHGIDFDFEIIGGFNSEDQVDEDWYGSIELPPNSADFEYFMKWLQLNVDWDIGVVPLEDSDFNRGKSELKYIELTAMGIPAVYSDMEVYNSVIEDGFNGLLASSTDEWVDKLEQLILDENLRQTLRNNALKHVLKDYILENRVKQWDNILSNI